MPSPIISGIIECLIELLEACLGFPTYANDSNYQELNSNQAKASGAKDILVDERLPFQSATKSVQEDPFDQFTHIIFQIQDEAWKESDK